MDFLPILGFVSHNTMEIKKLQDAELNGKKVLLRVDFNVAVENGNVKERFKIETCKDTVAYLLEKKAKVALVSHLGRPEGKKDKNFSLRQLQDEVSEILDKRVIFISNCVGSVVGESLDSQAPDEIFLLENVRFHVEDEKNDPEFAKKLAENFDIFVNDAFSVCHRNQASVTGVTEHLPSYAGLRLQKEIEEMEKIRNDFARPAVAIIGGAKIETKLPVIKFFEEKYDSVLVGGKIANEALDQKIPFGEKVALPSDFIDDRLDIGSETVERFKQILGSAATIVWNGPTGKFEDEKYSKSTNEMLKAVLESGAYTVVGGGETVEILEKNDAMSKVGFVSTGGGAMLEYLAGNRMPGIDKLS